MKKWFPILAVAAAMLFISPEALAEGGDKGSVGMAAGLAMGLAVLGGALGQGMAAKAVYESISRNPQAAGALNAPFYVGMAFIESLVLFTLVIAFMLQSKITF